MKERAVLAGERGAPRVLGRRRGSDGETTTGGQLLASLSQLALETPRQGSCEERLLDPPVVSATVVRDATLGQLAHHSRQLRIPHHSAVRRYHDDDRWRDREAPADQAVQRRGLPADLVAVRPATVQRSYVTGHDACPCGYLVARRLGSGSSRSR